ncbi:hypothetical protein CEUSTIGMA_g13161.t1 [Chlamydomonas eustigma]|uniref:Uncharacterized protein n=1 Tax=Chlamydomonas eustigma TaxID=1157962 RepID=A0A250XRS7_9CHLO|nr:hypothetical protein CEUSTIGMA_g13161.t1 [Chlamydomonas eustigma]|eukprot:GAX85746.1 hypothetical protein CEUSTIGMA_g13161.t1 [Chlamydomonas eustigma]
MPHATSTAAEEQSDRKFQVVLAILFRVWEDSVKFQQLLRQRPEPTSLNFLLWLADKEAQAEGDQKHLLGALCEVLVTARENMEGDEMNDLYISTLDQMVESRLALLSDVRNSELPGSQPDDHVQDSDAHPEGMVSDHCMNFSHGRDKVDCCTPASSTDSNFFMQENSGASIRIETSRLALRDQAIAQLTSNPELYAMQLAENVTGQPVLVSGFDPVYDLLLKAGPLPALTPEGITKGHAAATDLAQELKGRRKRSVASIIGRAKLTTEQADVLKAGTSASRILDMLLMQPTLQARLDLLPDCFTPPAQSSRNSLLAQTEEQPSQPQCFAISAEVSSDSEELWCTPSQLLSELEVRIRVISGGSSRDPSGYNNGALLLPQGSVQLNGPELVTELVALRDHIKLSWLIAMQPSAPLIQEA